MSRVKWPSTTTTPVGPDTISFHFFSSGTTARDAQGRGAALGLRVILLDFNIVNVKYQKALIAGLAALGIIIFIIIIGVIVAIITVIIAIIA